MGQVDKGEEKLPISLTMRAALTPPDRQPAIYISILHNPASSRLNQTGP